MEFVNLFLVLAASPQGPPKYYLIETAPKGE
jgi:hypothetical protein